MSGHNRWSKIKHKKAASDAKKSKGWTKYLKEITIAARMGGGDINGNPRLRSAVDKARGDNMPMDTIKRAIQKGLGEGDAVNYEELMYEVYGPGGAALLVEILTDNRNRTASELRGVIEKWNGKLAAAGAVAYQFKKRGTIVFENVDEDQLMEAALELGADDIQSQDGVVQVVTEPGQYLDIKEALEKKGFKAAGGEVAMVPESTQRLEGHDATAMAKLINHLEDHDDVQNVFTNAEIDDEVFEALG